MALQEPPLEAPVVEDVVALEAVDRLRGVDCFETDCAVCVYNIKSSTSRVSGLETEFEGERNWMLGGGGDPHRSMCKYII